MPLWQRLIIVGVVLLVTTVVARLIDRRIARRELSSEAITRYRVLRRSVMTAIFVVGLLSALLVIPQVRAVAGGLLASSAVVGIVVGFASQRTLGNFVAGLLIAYEKLASDTIRNATIRSREKVAEITVQVPLSSDLSAVVDRLREATRGEVFVNDLAGNGSIVI